MENSTVYYDEHSHMSTRMAEKFASRNKGVKIVAASEVMDTIVYEKNEKIGFIFAGVKGRIPESIENLVKRLVVDKQAYIFAFVVGGDHEARVIKEINALLKQRGMKLSSAYAEYILQKFSSDENLQLQMIEKDVEAERRLLDEFHIQMEKKKKAVVKKQYRKSIKDYFRQLKKNFK